MVEKAENKNKQGRWAKKAQKKKKAKSFAEVSRIRLVEMFDEGFGASRNRDKFKHQTKGKIYSSDTMKTYRQQTKRFAKWLEENHEQNISFNQAKGYIDEYLTHIIEVEQLSPWTISTAKAALAKVYGVSSTEFRKSPPRERSKIKRSRRSVKMDKHINMDVEQRLAWFTSATGCRRREMQRLTSDDLVFINGEPFLHLTKGTKHGKPRFAKIMGENDEDTKQIVEFIQSSKGRLFPQRIHKHYDNHAQRAEYTSRIYYSLARKVEDIPKDEKYIMRKDRAGEVLDRRAMKVASKYIGHYRPHEIAKSYIHRF
jgi:integrase